VVGLCIPYGKTARGFSARLPFAEEIIDPGAFRRSVETGLSARGKPIFACWGHKRAGRADWEWKIGSTADGSLRLWQDSIGVWFSLPHVDLPADFTGVSISLQAVSWRRETEQRWRLLEGFIKHVAILTGDESPAYKETLTWTRLLTLQE